MRSRLIGIVALAVVFAARAAAQVVPGDSPSMGIGAAVANSPSSVGGVSGSRAPAGPRSEYQGEQQYREALKKIPDRKASKDPWASIRTTTPAVDRHRVQ